MHAEGWPYANWTDQSQLGSALELSTLCCSSPHNNTLQVLQRTTLDTATPKDGPVCMYFLYMTQRGNCVQQVMNSDDF